MQYHPTEETEKPKAPRDGVPLELIDQLHEANEKLGTARQHLDEAIDSELGSLEKRGHAIDEVADAEKKLEESDKQIAPELRKTER